MPVDSITYRLVFDVQEAGYRYWWFPALGAAATLAGIVWLQFAKRDRESGVIVPPILVIMFAGGWTVFAFLCTFVDYRSLARTLTNGRYEALEGVVTQFTAGDSGDHTDEVFVVAGQRFEYKASRLTAGYNRTQPHGGVVREGARVRIAHVDGHIARLEIAP